MDTIKFGMVCYIVVDDQKNKGERLGKYGKLPLERKLIFDFFFPAEEGVWYVQTSFCQAHLGSYVHPG